MGGRGKNEKGSDVLGGQIVWTSCLRTNRLRKRYTFREVKIGHGEKLSVLLVHPAKKSQKLSHKKSPPRSKVSLP